MTIDSVVRHFPKSNTSTKDYEKAVSTFLVTLICLMSCSKNTFQVFGVKLSPKDVVGTSSYNDVGVFNYTTVINNLTVDTSTYLWRLGSVRVNAQVYQQGTIPLFNLSSSNHLSGYPHLDSIDFTYFRERGFQILENKEPNLSGDDDFKRFKDYMTDVTKSILDRKNYLWKDENKTWREKLLNTRYFVNIQPIVVKRKLQKRLTAEINAKLKTDLNDVLKIAVKQKDTVTHDKVDSVSISAYFQRTLTQTVDLKRYIHVSKISRRIHK